MPSSDKTSPVLKKTKTFTGPHTLAIDIGGTGLKASVLDAKGAMEADRVRVDTPYPCTPQVMVAPKPDPVIGR